MAWRADEVIGSIRLLHANFVKSSHLSKKALENCEPQIKVWFFPARTSQKQLLNSNVTPHASSRFCTFQNQRVFNNRSSKYYTATREVVNHWKNPPEIVITHEHKNHRHLVNKKIELEQKQKWLPGFLSFVFNTFFKFSI